MKCNDRMKKWLVLLLCVLMTAGAAVNGAMAAIGAEATDACYNAGTEGIEYFTPLSALAPRADEWRGQLTAEVVTRSDGSSAGTVVAMEIEAINSSPRYQCTDDILPPGQFSCNSFPANGLISGVYLRFQPGGSIDFFKNPNITFLVYPTVYGSASAAKTAGALLLEANAVAKIPPYPCARNYAVVKDFVAPDGKALVYNTSKECSSEHTTVDFIENGDRFAMVSIVPDDTLENKRIKMDVSPAVDFKYTLTLTFKNTKGTVFTVMYEYEPGKDPKITPSDFDGKTNSDLPIELVGGKIEKISATKTDLWGNPDLPTNVNFDIKFWYENKEETHGYNNSIFHFERRLNLQFAPYCDADPSKDLTGIAKTLYDPCDRTAQIFEADLVYTKSDGTQVGVKVPNTSAVTVATKEPEKFKTYRFITRKCVDASCKSVTTTRAYPYNITVSDGDHLWRTYKYNGNIYHKPGTRTEFNMKAYGTTEHPFSIIQGHLVAEEPGTYVIYGFVPESDYDTLDPKNYAVKFYVTVNTKEDLDTCSTLANNGYFRAYWNDCLDYRQTQLLTFEHMPDTEEAWIRNTSAHGVHFPYVSEWSYVPQQLEVASLTCRFEALTAAGRPGEGYCRPNDVYVPPFTKVTITGGTMYLASTPEYDQYRVAYARQDTYNISHLFFSVYVKECENVKKIPNTGITMRSLMSANESPDEATSYVFTGNSLRIPAIGLGMETPIPIVHVYYKEDSPDLEWDLSTLGNYVGELEGGTYLPYAGNSALTGHFSPFSTPAVFTNLGNLNYEDEVIVYGNDGIKYIYKVVEKFLAQPTDVYEMFQQVGERSLTLVTCENYNQSTDEYERRQIIRAVIDSQAPYEEGIW